jgi:Zn-dependent M28 family amino/carboxypeptidase
MRLTFLPLLLLSAAASAQTAPGPEAQRIAILKKDIGYLASEALEGRRTGSAGEAAARAYLIRRYQAMGIQPFKGNYDHPFPFSSGKHVGEESSLTLNGKKLTIGKEAFPLPWSADGEATKALVVPLYSSAEEASNPHFDWERAAFEKAQTAIDSGAQSLILWVPSTAKYPPAFNGKGGYETLKIPVFAVVSDSKMPRGTIPVTLNSSVAKDTGAGHNVAAFLNNKARFTVVIGAHYDHLGYGEDGSSLMANAVKEHQIHNGADDNASGTAAVLQLADWVKRTGLRHYNYLFVHFSGEELGLLGSKAFVKTSGLDSNNTACMINMDMVGRLVDSTKALTIGGIGTSPAWGNVVPSAPFKIVTDSSGIGPSDHTSFYLAGIPVLFFFTGTHHDYHKPSDDADKINYAGEALVINAIQDVITKVDAAPKPRFTATKQSSVGKVRFKVTLGIMPDYAFNDGGVRADGVSDGKPGAKAGLKAGDIIVQLGSHKVSGMQTYMEALSKFKEGESTTVKIRRGEKELTLPVTF